MTTPTQVQEYDETDHAAIEALLMGRRIVKAEMGEVRFPTRKWPHAQWGYAEGALTLDDGTILYLEGHEGGCSCSSGDYWLTQVAAAPNVITSVRFEDEPDDEWDGSGGDGHYSIYVWAENREISVARFEGSDGNGYYGTGYRIHVVRPQVGA